MVHQVSVEAEEEEDVAVAITEVVVATVGVVGEVVEVDEEAIEVVLQEIGLIIHWMQIHQNCSKIFQ